MFKGGAALGELIAKEGAAFGHPRATLAASARLRAKSVR
ncbi:MAG: hypothetical protein OGMRLDGQ_000957, partial [Candidatus Fervidibacter sp.]